MADIDTPPQLTLFLPELAGVDEWTAALNGAMERFEIDTPQRAAAFLAQPYERKPEALANYVYAKRLGNGDAASGDGWRFRGRGLNHLADDQNDDNDDQDFVAITKAINGGTAGLTSRRQYWVRAQTALGLPPRGAGV